MWTNKRQTYAYPSNEKQLAIQKSEWLKKLGGRRY
jgi:hypothetical protein